MATDFNHKIKQQDLLDQIVDELYENAELYAPDASKIYTDEIVDMIVCATANVIGYNLAIFQNIGGQAIMIFTQCINKNTSDTLYLKYDCPGFDSTNHYSAIVIKKMSYSSQPNHLPASLPNHEQAMHPHLQASLPNHQQAIQPHHLQAHHVENFKKNHLKMKNL